MTEEDLAYWRTLAEERGRALEALYARLHHALALLPESEVARFGSALSGRRRWMNEPDHMEPLSELRPSDIASVLDELWTRVAADR